AGGGDRGHEGVVTGISSMCQVTCNHMETPAWPAAHMRKTIRLSLTPFQIFKAHETRGDLGPPKRWRRKRKNENLQRPYASAAKQPAFILPATPRCPSSSAHRYAA